MSKLNVKTQLRFLNRLKTDLSENLDLNLLNARTLKDRSSFSGPPLLPHIHSSHQHSSELVHHVAMNKHFFIYFNSSIHHSTELVKIPGVVFGRKTT